MTPSTTRPAGENVLEAARPAGVRFGPLMLAWVHVAPLVNRFRRGEGLLVAVALSVALAVRPDPLTFFVQAVLSTAVIALLYCLNDVHDCRQDLNDPGKDQAFVRFLVEWRTPLLWLLAFEHAAVVLFAARLLGPRSAVAVAFVLAVNVTYSAFFKGRAVVDVLWVAVWGAACAALPGVKVPVSMLALVGIMTSICHVFQITRDRPIDDRNRVRTSAVAVRWLPDVQLATACAAMGFVLFQLLGPLAAASAAIPFVLRLTLKSNQAAWLLSKAYYGAVWLLALGTLRG